MDIKGQSDVVLFEAERIDIRGSVVLLQSVCQKVSVDDFCLCEQRGSRSVGQDSSGLEFTSSTIK